MIIRQLTAHIALAFAVCASYAAPLELISKPFQERPNSAGDSGGIALSLNGDWAVFTSTGNGIVTNDNNGPILDVFLRNLQTGETILVSKGTNGASGNAHSYGEVISPDGRLVLFETDADNLLPDDENEAGDVVLYDRANDQLTAISVTTDGLAEGASGAATMTQDGRFILFETEAAGFSPLDQNDLVDLYLLDRQTGNYELISVNSNNTAAATAQFPSTFVGTFEGSVSGDGRYVAFLSSGTNHVRGVGLNAAPQLYLRDRVNQTNYWLSRMTNGNASAMVASPVVSTNGAFVAFISSNLDTSSPPISGNARLYLQDIAAGERRIVSIGPVDDFVVSENGQFIAYSASNQVVLYDITTRSNRLVSATATGAPADGVSSNPAISADGRYVIFTSASTNLSADVTGQTFQLFRFDQQTGEVALLSRAAGGTGSAGEDVHFPVISADGLKAGFGSYASNLATNDNPLANDVFVVDTSGTNPVALASAAHPSAIMSTAAGSSSLEGQALSLDGRRIVFVSNAADLVPNDSNLARDIFVRDLSSGQTRRLRSEADGAALEGAMTLMGMSHDGEIIAFTVSAAEGQITTRKAWYHHTSAGTNKLASITPDGAITNIADALLSPNGRYIAFRETAPVSSSLFIRDLETEVTTRVQPFGMTGGTQPLAFSPQGKYLVVGGNSAAILNVQSDQVVTNNLSINPIGAGAFTADDSTLLVSIRSSPAASWLTLYSLDGSTTNRVIATNAVSPVISADGSTVVYQLRPLGQPSVLYTYDVASRVATPLTLGGTNVDFRLRNAPSLSADGRFIAFGSTNAFSAGGDDNDFTDIFVYDRILKTVRLVSRDADGNGGDLGSSSPSISADGRVLAFDSAASDLVANDRNIASDVFVTRLEQADTDGDGLEDGWETIHFDGLGGVAEVDSDSDGVSNRDESLAGTNPKNADSKFSIVPAGDGEAGLTLSSPATVGRAYQLQHRASLTAGEWQNVGPSVVVFSGMVSFDAPVDLGTAGFYRIQAL